MSYKSKRAELHKVKKIPSIRGNFYEVNSVSGEKYTVELKMSCDCRYSSVQGISNGKICSHTLAVLKKIIKEENKK